MKSLSASIIVFAGAHLAIGALPHRQSDAATFQLFVSFVLVVAGLVGWFLSLRNKE